MSVNTLLPFGIATNNSFRIYSIRLSLLVLFLIESSISVLAYKQTYNVNVGETFTVYTTSHYYTQSVLWTYDARIVEPVGYVGSATTSIKFKAKQAVSSYVIQAITYYYESSTSNTLLRSVDDWLVKITDNSKVTLDKNSITLSRGESFTLNATASNPEYAGKYNWSSSNTDVAYIVGYGTRKSEKISTLYSGNATITVKLDNGNSATCYVTVKDVDVKSASISPTYQTLKVGETAPLSLSVSPNDAKITSKSWISKNTNIATVDSYGTVTAVSSGTTEIYCVVNGNVTSNSCELTVKEPIAPTGITVSPTVMYINKGETRKLNYSLTPYDATTTVTWSSDNTSIATVNSNGEVKGVKKGVTTIRATTENGKTATCEVNVNTIEATSISLPTSQTVYIGETVNLSYTIVPSNATNSVTWSSEDTYIARVSQAGEVHGINLGKTKITATTDNGLTATCELIVENAPAVEPTEIKLYDCKVEKGQICRIRYELIPSNAAAKISWTSSNSDVATITSEGVVTGVRNNAWVTITATTDNGLSASCTVKVEDLLKFDYFYGSTEDDRGITYSVTDVDKRTCEAHRAYDRNIKKAVIPTSVQGYTVTAIGNGCFYSYNDPCEMLSTVTIPNSIISIGEKAFMGCTSLKSIDIPSSVTTICRAAFASCSYLENVTLHDGLEMIDVAAFNLCKSLKSIVIPNTVTTMGNNAFSECDSLESVSLSTNLKRIEYGSFEKCTSLTTITNFENIEYIGSGVFYYTPFLENLPNGINYFGKVLLTYKGIIPENTTITVKEGTTQITSGCFRFDFNRGLVGIYLPSSIKEIGDEAFYECTGLINVTSFNTEPTAIGVKSFDDNVYSNATLNVPTGTKPLYQSTEGWNMFKNIVEFDPSGIDAITIDEDDQQTIYSISGMKLRKPKKGLNIINGKKVLVK